MERHKKDKKQRKKAPRVPIKTYKWEDVRRARLKGGYPWTYLYKEPFDENIDPKLFTMEAMTKSKSSSALEKPNEGLDIKEVVNGTDGNLTPEPSGYIVITEVPSDSESHSKNVPGGSVTIEDIEEPEILNLESAESSDNISQYLDKEETAVGEPQTPTTKTNITSENGRQERAKSEEPKRKRKLSIDSSYSRKSLSKLAIIKKLKEAKEKIKVPKLNLPKSLKPGNLSKSKTETEKPKEIKKETKPSVQQKPVYIHIPLKPPDGQTDEFSYLEFGDKKPEEPSPKEKPKTPEQLTPTIQTDTLTPEQIPEKNDERRFSGNPDEIVAFEVLKSETLNLPEGARNGLHGSNILIIQQDDDRQNDDVFIIMPDDEPNLSRSENDLSKIPKRQNSSRKGRAKSAEPERKRKLSADSGYSGVSLSKTGLLKKLKDAKDKFKFPKLSLSRSNSKKSQKKKTKEEPSTPKEVQEVKKPHSGSKEPKYIHIPLKPPPGQTDEFSYLEFEEKKEEPPIITKKETPPIKEEQSSIDSPASVKNEGVQFIFLTPPSDDEILDHPDVPETPSSESGKSFFAGGINELKKIAKDAVDEVSPKSKRKILEPVSEEEDKKDKEIHKEEKEVDETKGAIPKKIETPKETVQEKMVVDEEDGLKLTESAMAKQEQNIRAKEVTEHSQELKPNIKSDGSPILKKKVSFKRRSRDDSKDGDYEDIQTPKDKPKEKDSDEHKSKLSVMGTSQSMSVDEEKSYLDEKKVIKSTSLEEDYNRWSKLSDHEYEPVNPPPDNVSPPAPTVHITDTDQEMQQKSTSKESSTTSLERRMLGAEPETSPEESFTVEEMQTQIENKFFRKTPEPSPKSEVPSVRSKQVESPAKENQPPKTETPGKLHQAFKTQAGKIRTKLHEMKKPNIKLPSKEKFQKFKFDLPKIPDTTKINLPTFSLPRKSSRSLKQRQYSTESNAGGSKKKYFDFRTYPRFFKKKRKNDNDSFSSKSEREVPEFATVPRTKRNNQKENDRWGGRDSIRIPLHPEDLVEDENNRNDREDSLERRMASHIRYDEDIDIDDAYERENQEIHTVSPFSHDYNSRWNHGSFHPEPNLEFQENNRNRQITDLDSPEDEPAPQESFDTNNSKDIHSSESSLGIHRRGVLEEIDSDEFFLRQKGISQDNIEVGMYLSSEIREAFKSPTNALAELQRDPHDFSYDVRASNQSLPETPSKRKAIKKPKRKKTPHVSQEQIDYEQDSGQELFELPPSRPKRRSKRNKKSKDEEENVVPYQETIHVEPVEEKLGILQNRDDEREEYKVMYENEQMEGKEQPEIKVSDPYADFRYDSDDEVFKDEKDVPTAPRRKNRSLKSLTLSEHDSIMGEFNLDKEPDDFKVYTKEHEYIIPTPEIPPTKPPRTLSRSSSSKSRDNEEIREEVEETPIRPTRSRSRTRSHGDSLANEEPCVEEPCVQDFRDYMGYAVIDKHTKREPPLPPSTLRTPPPRRKRSAQSTKSSVSEQKFFTVPRPLNDEPPMRPMRNYSTLGPSRPPRRKPPPNMTDEEKENIDITQYIEIEDEPNRDLHSGEVIQKMRDRPLPAPPRPPRKTRALQDITSQENIAIADGSEDAEKNEYLEETEVSTQTEPLPDDFVCEEIQRDDPVITEQPQEQTNAVTVETRLITPTHYTYEEETITHGSLVVEPLNGAKILPDSEITKRETPTERSIPVMKDYEDEMSEIPEEFTKLKDPTPASPTTQPSVIERIIERPVVIQPDSNSEVEVLKAHKLQVSDLDVDRLSVNELLASKIIVSEIDSGSIQTNEISSKTGALKLGEIELPPSIVQQLFEKLQSVAQEQSSGPTDTKPVTDTSTKTEDSDETGQKKTPFENLTVETLPQRPPRKNEEIHEITTQVLVDDKTEISSNVELALPETDSLDVIEILVDDKTEISSDVELALPETDSLDVIEIEEIQGTTIPPEPPVRSDSSKEPENIQLFQEPQQALESVPEIPQELEISERQPSPSSEPFLESEPLPETDQTLKPLQEIQETSILESQQFVEPFLETQTLSESLSETQQPPQRPPRQSEKPKTSEFDIKEQQLKMEEPEIDDEPPPRPPEPEIDYFPSQPPPSFYALRAQQYIDGLEGDIPMAPRRRRHHKPPISRSSSDESPAQPPSRRRYRSPEPSIPQLTGQLVLACGSTANSSLKRLMAHITNNLLRNADGQQDTHVMIVILIVLIAGLILLSGDVKTVHHHHWEYFNPPRDM